MQAKELILPSACNTPSTYYNNSLMTVVALLFSETIPIGITDNLISGAAIAINPINTPITEQEQREGLPGMLPVGLGKKHWYMEGENIYFLFAGTVRHAKNVFNYIQGKLPYQTPYDDAMHADVVEYISRNDLTVAFILLRRDASGLINHFYKNASIYHDEKFGKVVLIGSGATPLAEVMRIMHAPQLPQTSPEHLGSHVDIAIYNATALAGALKLEYEKKSSKLAGKSTGGNFNIIYFPELYQFDREDIPASVRGVTHASIRITADEIYLESLIHTTTAWGNDPVNTIAFNGDVRMTGEVFAVPAEQLRDFVIADNRTNSSVRSAPEKLHIIGYNLVIFAYIKVTDGTSLQRTQAWVARGPDPVQVTEIRRTDSHVECILDTEIVSNFIDSLRKAAVNFSRDIHPPHATGKT